MSNTNESKINSYKNMKYISLIMVSKVLKVHIETLQTICKEHGIGSITEDGHIFLGSGKEKSVLEDLNLLEFYYNNKDIENRVINYIKKNQPTTITSMAKDFNVTRERMWGIVDDLTYKDRNLYEMVLKKRSCLFYLTEEDEWGGV